jgi:hypothetical protein
VLDFGENNELVVFTPMQLTLPAVDTHPGEVVSMLRQTITAPRGGCMA